MSPLRYLSVCSGIEAATVAWHPLGWQPIAFSEIEPFPCAVLAHHYPHVPNLGDMTRYHDWPAPCTCTICATVHHASFTIGGKTHQIYVCTTCGGLSIDLLCGGTPCQGFSISGLRGGLDDPRSQLSLTYVEIAARYRARWLVWENVPGVLNSAGGRDFAAILGALTGRQIPIPKEGWENSGVIEGIPDAYGIAWRVLDAQYCGVPQRRRRVFIVGYLGDWRRAAAVLFERHSLQGNPPPSRQAGKNVAHTISARTKGGGGLGTDFDCDGGLIASTGEVSHCLNAGGMGRQDYETETETETETLIASAQRAEPSTVVAHTTGAGFWKEGFGTLRARAQDSHENLVAHALTGEGFDASEDGTGRGTPIIPIDMRQASRGENVKNDRRPGAVSGGPSGTGIGNDGDPAFTVTERGQAVAFSPQAGGKQTTLGFDADSNTSPSLIVGQAPAIAFDTTQITSKANRSNPQPGGPCHPLAAGAHAPAIAIQERALAENPSSGPDGLGIRDDDTAYTLEARTTPQAVAYNVHAKNSNAMSGAGPTPAAFETEVSRCVDTQGFTENQGGTVVVDPVRTLAIRGRGDSPELEFREDGTANALLTPTGGRGGVGVGAIQAGMAVRRLTPTECERLQGFPDDYTLVPHRGKPAKDGPRYKALGNSWAVPCATWLGRRIELVENLTRPQTPQVEG